MKAIRVRMKQVVGFGEALRLSHAVSASSSTCVCDGVRGTSHKSVFGTRTPHHAAAHKGNSW